MRTAQILLGLIIAPPKKDLLGMDTHAQVKKKTFNLILIPTEIYRMWLYYGIFHQVELDIFFFLIYFFFLTLLLLTYTGMGECSNVIRVLAT